MRRGNSRGSDVGGADAEGGALQGVLAGAADFLAADLVIAFAWRDDRTAVVRATSPALTGVAPGTVLSLDRSALAATGGVVLDVTTPRRLVSSALQSVLPGRPTAAWVAAADTTDTGAGTAPPSGGLLAVWCGDRAPDPALADAARFGGLRDAVARALRADTAARADDDLALRFDAIMAAVPQAVVFVDDTGGNGLVNAAAAALLGVPAGPVAPAELAARMSALRARAAAEAVRVADGDAHAPTEHWVWKLGAAAAETPRTLRVAVLPVTRDGSRGRLWTFDDVTGEVAAADALHASEAAAAAAADELRAVFAAMRDVVLVYDGEGTYVRVMPTAPERLFRPLDGLVGRRVHDVLPADVADRILATVRQVLATGTAQHLEYSLAAPDGLQRLAGTGSPLGDGTVLWVARDITARKVAEAALADSESRYRVLFDRNPLPVWVYDVETLAFLAVNAAAEALYGYTAEAFVGALTLRDLHRGEPAAFDAQRTTPTAGALLGVRRRHWTRDGRLLEVETSSHPIIFGGRAARLVIAHDVSARVRAEAALRTSEARFRAAMDASPEASFLLEAVRDADGRIADFTFVEANAGVGTLYGMSPDDVVGHPLCGLFPAFRGSTLFARYLSVVETGAPYEGEYQTRDPRAQAGWLWVQAVALRNDGGAVVGLAVTARDITDRKRAEGERRLVHEVTAALSGAVDIEQALGAALRAMCAASGMDYGEAWMPAPDGVLVRGPAWYAPEDAALAAFDEATRAFTFAAGVGLPGNAAAAGVPVWLSDLAAPGINFPRAALAARAGLRSGLAVPILADGLLVTVLAFHVRHGGGVDAADLDRLAAVGAQVGALVRRRQAEAALVAERAFLDAVLESLTEGVVACDAAGRLTLLNDAARAVRGHSAPGEARLEYGAEHHGLYHADGRTPLARDEVPLVRTLRDGTLRDAEVVVMRAGQTPRRIEASGRRFTGADGQVLGAVVALHDVTERAEAAAALEREREFLAVVLESLGEGVVACDAEGRLTLFNAAAREFHGLPASGDVPLEHWAEHYALYGADGETALPSDGIPLVRALRGEVVRGAEMVIAARGQPPRTLAASGRSFADRTGRSLGAVVAMHDVTERAHAERRKSEFVTTVSHELRTPLTSIRGSLALIEAGVVGALPDKARALVGIAISNAERLIRLVTDVLDLDKIEAGKLEYAMARQNAADVVGVAADGIAGMATAARVEIVTQVETCTAVLGDRDRLIQVLTNLLSNAIKFSPRDSVVVLRACDHADEGGRPVVRFAVEDYGPGIPPEKLALLFQKFRQLGVTDATRRGGTGLGLAITKAIIEQHGGRVGVASEPGRRTVFWCDLPADAPASTPPAA